MGKTLPWNLEDLQLSPPFGARSGYSRESSSFSGRSARTKPSGRDSRSPPPGDPTPEPPAGEQLKAALCCPLVVVRRYRQSLESRLLQPQSDLQYQTADRLWLPSPPGVSPS